MNTKKTKSGECDKILCLTDFSEASQHALRWATDMAATLQAHLTILYSYRLLESKIEVIYRKKQTETEALQKFLQWETELLVNKKVDYEFRSEVGFMTDRVAAFVDQNAVCMLVIDNKMINDNKETIQQLIENLRVPMVIVPSLN